MCERARFCVCVEAGARNLLESAYIPLSLSLALSASLSQSSQTERQNKMEIIFDCFFEETFRKLERSGLKARNKRKDVIDHLTAIVLGTSRGKELCDGARVCGANDRVHTTFIINYRVCHVAGQNLPASHTCMLAVESAIGYHRAKRTENNNVYYS